MSDLINHHASSITAEDEDIAQLKAQIALMQKGVNDDKTMATTSSSFHAPYPASDAPSAAMPSYSNISSSSVVVPPEKEEADRRSVHVAQVDYSTTADQLQAHFSQCGSINRVNIMVDKYTHQPKGFAYLEFASVEAAHAALTLNDSVINNRQIKVTPKRTNIPGLSASRGRGGRGARGRGGRGMARGGYAQPYGAPYYNYPYSPASFVAPYAPYPYPPPPSHNPAGAPPSYFNPMAPQQGYQQAGGAYRRGGGPHSGARGVHRFSPYGGGSDRRGGGRGRGRAAQHGDDMFTPNDNSSLPRMGGDVGLDSTMNYGSSDNSSYPVEEQASGHFQ